MSDYLDRPVYADIEEEARDERAEWLLLKDDRPTRADFCDRCHEERGFCTCSRWSR